MDSPVQFSVLPSKVFLVGIGGIGMSGLAQLLRWQGHDVAGSDRGLDEPGKDELYAALRRQGIRLYAQDGSGVRAEAPDALIISTAVESNNPDLQVMPACPVVHRAKALAAALNRLDGKQIAVAGSCGKTSVTGWIASALRALGEDVLMVNGGYSLDAETDVFPGNFAVAGQCPRWLVYEVDESDRSLNAFTPDYGVLLNVGNDHYSQDELRVVFAGFLERCRCGVAVLADLADLAANGPRRQALFAAEETLAPGVLYPMEYAADAKGIRFQVPGFGEVLSSQSGRHSAVNATATLALLSLLDLSHSPRALAGALAAFPGVRQRFEVIGQWADGTAVINDYAHNPEKIAAALSTARERFGSPLLACFQPHGFRPLEFMRATLLEALRGALEPDDRLLLLPVYYAGGSASFKPTSEEVAAELAAAGLPVQAATRLEAEALIRKQRDASCCLVMGARDSSLREWTKQLTREEGGQWTVDNGR